MAAAHTHRILIAEDEPLIGNLYRDALTQAGFAVTVAKNGDETMVAMRETKPDLVLLDILMPRVDGLGVLEAKRTDPLLRAIPVIVVSNFSAEYYAEQAKALGAVGYLVKAETDIHEIVRTVKQQLGMATR